MFLLLSRIEIFHRQRYPYQSIQPNGFFFVFNFLQFQHLLIGLSLLYKSFSTFRHPVYHINDSYYFIIIISCKLGGPISFATLQICSGGITSKILFMENIIITTIRHLS